MSFGLFATIIGFLVDGISIYQLIKNSINRNTQTKQPYQPYQPAPYPTQAYPQIKKKSEALNYILLVIGSLVLVTGIIIMNPRLISKNILNIEPTNTAGTIDGIDDEDDNKQIWIDQMQVFAYDNGGHGVNRYEVTKSVIANTGENLNHAVTFTALDVDRNYVYPQYLEYYLNSKYDKFNGIITLSDKSIDSKGGYIFEVFLDDENVAKYTISKGFIPVHLDLDVSSTKIMKIQITNNHTGHDTSVIALGNAYFSISK